MLAEAKCPAPRAKTGEKYQKKFDDDEEPEKKITPLTDEYDTPIYHCHALPMECNISGKKIVTPL